MVIPDTPAMPPRQYQYSPAHFQVPLVLSQDLLEESGFSVVEVRYFPIETYPFGGLNSE
jgi:hypothetical protein